MIEDVELLRRYVKNRSEAAFAELVGRHLILVYSVALRQVGGDSHLAQDVVQQVFAALARKAPALTDRPTLSGWLYRSTHFAASDIVRGERRRRAREKEAHTMEPQDYSGMLTPSPVGNGIDWENVRPTIDAAIAELDERDRDAVSLRYFDGCSFAVVGARLRLTENAARMRVERALDKLHAALSRRGVTSTSAALGLALANQVVAGAPAGLAATITGAALAGSAAGGAGILAFLGTSKAAVGIGTGVAAAALGVAVVQHDGKQDAQTALSAVEQQRHALQIELGNVTARLEQSERRAAEAEKDSGELLRAVQEMRAEQAAQAAMATKSGFVGGIIGKTSVAASPEEDERLVYERLYQQQLARSRADEAKARAKIDYDSSLQDDATTYARLIETAEHLAANAEFQSAIRMYNKAMEVKPRELPVGDQVKQLQALLAAQNTPVDVTFNSDGRTWVSIVNFRAPEKFSTTSVRTLPGDYQVVGRRTGYRDVMLMMQVRNGVPAPVVSVACTVTVAP